MSSKIARKLNKRFYITCLAVTLAILLTLLAVFLYQRSQVAPVYVLTVEGLKADSPAEAQALCRRDNERFLKSLDGKDHYLWAWCGDDELFLVKPELLTTDTEADAKGFSTVSFIDEDCNERKGYIIDPTLPPNELGRIQLGEAEEYTFDSVSMSLRVALREGSLSYDGAVFLWEAGSSTVFAVVEGSFTATEEDTVSFIDDGGETHLCYILDTKLD